MWMAENWESYNGCKTETHPTRIRQSHRETTAAASRGEPREQRQLWRSLRAMREVGEALRYGRALYPSNSAFGAWCRNEGFDMKPQVHSDAMWMAENWSVLHSVEDGYAHPTHIRQSHREATADTPPSPSLHIESPSRLTTSVLH